MVITPDQIRAARALKNWSQAELAARIDMATPSIGNIEAGKHIASPQTQAAIIETFESAGVEFISNGVRHRQDLVQVYEGGNCYLRLLDQVFRVLTPVKGEVLFSGSDERRSPPDVIEKLRSLRRSGIHMRSLIREGDRYFMGQADEYRSMPAELFVDSDVKVIFDDFVAFLISWQDVRKVITIKDRTIASEARRNFNFIWALCPVPETTQSPVRYEES